MVVSALLVEQVVQARSSREEQEQGSDRRARMESMATLQLLHLPLRLEIRRQTHLEALEMPSTSPTDQSLRLQSATVLASKNVWPQLSVIHLQIVIRPVDLLA